MLVVSCELEKLSMAFAGTLPECFREGLWLDCGRGGKRMGGSDHYTSVQCKICPPDARRRYDLEDFYTTCTR